jgi:hypothetical protein
MAAREQEELELNGVAAKNMAMDTYAGYNTIVADHGIVEAYLSSIVCNNRVVSLAGPLFVAPSPKLREDPTTRRQPTSCHQNSLYRYTLVQSFPRARQSISVDVSGSGSQAVQT